MMKHVDATRTLLLSQGYEPIKVISWQRAMTLLTLDKVDVVEHYDIEVRAMSIIVKVPAVIRLRKAFRRHTRPDAGTAGVDPVGADQGEHEVGAGRVA